MLPSGRTYELEFRSDIKPHKCQVPSCSRTAEIVLKSQRSQAWRLPARSPEDVMMGQPEWETWSTEGFRSYCTEHKCDVMGCDRGQKFDENGQLFNLCQTHCTSSEKEAERSEGTKKLSTAKIVRKIFSSSTPKPDAVVRRTLQKDDIQQRRFATPLTICNAKSCERFQVLNSRGEGGQCEIHTIFPTLQYSSSAGAGAGAVAGGIEPVPPIAVLYDVSITGRARRGNATGPPVEAGALVVVNGVIAAVTSGLGM